MDDETTHLMSYLPTPPEPRSPFNEAWRAFLAEFPNSTVLPADQRAMLRRGFVYGWRAREVAFQPR